MSERKSQHSDLTIGGTHPKSMSERPNTHIWPHLVRKALHLHPTSSCQKGAAPTSDHVGTNPSVTSEWLCTHIWSCKTTSHSHIRMALGPRLIIPGNWPGASIPRMEFSSYIWSCRNQSYSHIRMAQHSHLTWKEPNPLTMTEWLSPYIWPWKQPNPFTMSEWLMDSSLPLGGNLDLKNTKLLSEVLKLHFDHF